jgi:hypothetical protein
MIDSLNITCLSAAVINTAVPSTLSQHVAFSGDGQPPCGLWDKYPAHTLHGALNSVRYVQNPPTAYSL